MMIVLAVPETKLLLKEVLQFCFPLIFSNAHYLQEYTFLYKKPVYRQRNFRTTRERAKKLLKDSTLYQNNTNQRKSVPKKCGYDIALEFNSH